MGPKPATVACHYYDTGLSRPAAAAALAIPDLAALIFSAYCNAIRGDFHPPACMMSDHSEFQQRLKARGRTTARIESSLSS